MNKNLFALTGIFVAAATAAAAGGSTKGTGGYNGSAKTGLTSERLGDPTKDMGALAAFSDLSARAGPAQASMDVVSITLPTEVAR